MSEVETLQEADTQWAQYPPFSTDPELTEAIKDWIRQGRSQESIHGVLNFFSGRGMKLRYPAPTQEKPEEPTIDWLIDQLCPESSPLVDFNKNRLRQLINSAVAKAVSETAEQAYEQGNIEGRKEGMKFMHHALNSAYELEHDYDELEERANLAVLDAKYKEQQQ